MENEGYKHLAVRIRRGNYECRSLGDITNNVVKHEIVNVFCDYIKNNFDGLPITLTSRQLEDGTVEFDSDMVIIDKKYLKYLQDLNIQVNHLV